MENGNKVLEEKKILNEKPDIENIFLDIIKEYTAGNPMDETKWTNLKQREISEIFKEKGYDVSEYIVAQLLENNGYKKIQAYKSETYKDVEGRDEQFKNIDNLKNEFLKDPNNPILSIDVKKKEQIGNFYRDGKLYTQETVKVLDHDFPSYGEGAIVPYGIFDMKLNEAYMTIGTSKETSEFWCDCFKDWWNEYGRENYPNATEILILVDGGGSNSSRTYIFKEYLQKLVNELGIIIRIAHYPPYTSKYNPIEHRVFCHITRACEGVVFSSVEIVKELMGKATTKTGLKVFAKIKDKIYKAGNSASDFFKENMEIVFDSKLGKWNYMALPLK